MTHKRHMPTRAGEIRVLTYDTAKDTPFWIRYIRSRDEPLHAQIFERIHEGKRVTVVLHGAFIGGKSVIVSQTFEGQQQTRDARLYLHGKGFTPYET